jgi:cytochrome c-type biogenesis protein CcmH
VRDLPRDFVLDDTMAMAPGVTLSSAKEVVVEARVSKGGSATPASGDLVGKSAPVAPGTTNIHVRIDAVNP